MPSRIIREGILTSERVNALSMQEEIFYRRLMSVVDDFGRFDGRPEILRVTCFPLRVDQVRVADISRWTAACEKAGLIVLYSVNNRPYIEMIDFRQQKRAMNSRYPAPGEGLEVSSREVSQNDDQMTDECMADDTQMRSTCVADAMHMRSVCTLEARSEKREKGSTCHVQKNEHDEYSTEFLAFWEIYPRRIGKTRAWKTWKARIRESSDPQAMLQAARNYADDCRQKQTEDRFIKHPSTFLGPDWIDWLNPRATVMRMPESTSDDLDQLYGSGLEERNRKADEAVRAGYQREQEQKRKASFGG